MIRIGRRVLKEIVPADITELTSFFNRNNTSSILQGFSAFPLKKETAILICSQNHLDKYYLYIEENIIKGFSMLRGWDEGYSIPSFGIFVDKDFQGLGLGSKILNLTLEKCRSLGCQKVRLSVFSSNKIAYKLYTNFGFYEIERSSTFNNGKVDEKIIMFKDL